jgi:hypothetical protein
LSDSRKTCDRGGDGRVDFGAEGHEQMMLVLGRRSKREIIRTKIRVRTAMAAQTREQGRYLGGRPPYGYQLADAGSHRLGLRISAPMLSSTLSSQASRHRNFTSPAASSCARAHRRGPLPEPR